MTLSLQT